MKLSSNVTANRSSFQPWIRTMSVPIIRAVVTNRVEVSSSVQVHDSIALIVGDTGERSCVVRKHCRDDGPLELVARATLDPDTEDVDARLVPLIGKLRRAIVQSRGRGTHQPE